MPLRRRGRPGRCGRPTEHPLLCLVCQPARLQYHADSTLVPFDGSCTSHHTLASLLVSIGTRRRSVGVQLATPRARFLYPHTNSNPSLTSNPWQTSPEASTPRVTTTGVGFSTLGANRMSASSFTSSGWCLRATPWSGGSPCPPEPLEPKREPETATETDRARAQTRLARTLTRRLMLTVMDLIVRPSRAPGDSQPSRTLAVTLTLTVTLTFTLIKCSADTQQGWWAHTQQGRLCIAGSAWLLTAYLQRQ